MVGGAAEPRLQATHRDRCTDSRARMSPRGVDSLESSLVAREGRLLAGAGALRSSLDGRCLRSGPTHWLDKRAARARESFR